ncbi:conserved Plasmodium protein, unknown function [Plasmodium knowlesi strain H]|uniref:Uncharacterized protein n=3 Tax=Plasmodium knowlesi TaxID=5850 RepID=A0A5K1TXN6_PLAKH|nr:protein TOC75, putative [Plasmodium knowlesi strain H]OTN63793.1 Uncharacterized protein PKNOH_S140272200 [Plasmodium knowlesi]CAA9991136.1 protein TOC75, putative [Plasmodium knowlesi strain H]SBO20548.1 conserved Plasmodium protein, unknown function [Plasmodium knowlesi strain H]SBO20927.1 conserved Plasmodium protein, unknown function [Plasmodium knowlesi strain H]VVS80610.1 protein TOC75, putative [Plasmodium knowlesi strain H]|eukprot:XP_002262420.1 hypothetical protein, conserved in Plasmodium species [Plasmodium knowlesi strain H]
MKNVARLCVWLLILANWNTLRSRRVCERGARGNYSRAAILSSGHLNDHLNDHHNDHHNDHLNDHHNGHLNGHHRGRKTNDRNLLFLKNKLKEIWSKFTTKGSHYFNEPSKEEQKSFNLKNVFQSFSQRSENDIISRVVVRGSTVISPTLLDNLLSRENIKTIRHKDIEGVVKIVSNFYTKSNYLFSRVLRHEVVKDGNQDILIIYVEEFILGPGCVQIRVFRRGRPPTTETGKKTETEMAKGTTTLGSTPTIDAETTTGTTPKTDAGTTPSAPPADANPQEEVIFERKGSASGVNAAAPSPDDLQKPEAPSNKLRKLFEKKMKIKEGSIFMWDQDTFDMLLKSNLFNYIHVKLLHDKLENKHLLQIDIVENRKFSFIPSISKSFNSLLDLCMNVTLGYLHSVNYGDKFRLKFFKNLSYRNHKHDYDIVYVNDIVELEKLRRNLPAYFIFGVNVNGAFKKEQDNSALNECVNIMNRQGENEEKKESENGEENLNSSGEQHTGQHDVLPRGSPPQRKNIYSYLHREKVFLFGIRKIWNTIFEIKLKAKKELFHNLLYFLGKRKGHSAGGVNSGRIFPLHFLSFRRNLDDNQVLSKQLYNIYGSKLKLSSCLNAYSSSWFENSKCMKAFFNVKNKVDLVFYFNMDRKFRRMEENTHEGETGGNEADVKSMILSFLEDANKRGGFFWMDKIRNVYLNYTFYFQKNYKVNIFDLFCKLKRVFTYRGGKATEVTRHAANGKEPPLVLFPLLYKCKIIMNQVHLLVNVAFFFKKTLWDLRQGYNLPSICGLVGGKTNGKGIWSYYYHQVKELFLENTQRTRKKGEPNFEEELERITLPRGHTSSTESSPPNSTTYNICSVNLNDAQKEQQNKIKLTMNYKLIFPVLFENYFLNMMDLKLYLFLNCSLFGSEGSTSHGEESAISPIAMNEDSRKSALYNYLKLSFLRNKRKIHHSAFGLGLLLSNMNIFLNFQCGRRSMLPSLVLQLDQVTSRFKYLS